MAKPRLEGSNPSLSATIFPGSSRGIRTGAAADAAGRKVFKLQIVSQGDVTNEEER